MPLIYLDSSIVIYLIERHPVYSPLIETSLLTTPDLTPAVSSLVRLEVLVNPMKSARKDLIDLYNRFLMAAEWLSFDDTTFDLALDLRVRHRLKTPDALHLAVARQYDCEFLWTNDDRLSIAAGKMSVNLLDRQA